MLLSFVLFEVHTEVKGNVRVTTYILQYGWIV